MMSVDSFHHEQVLISLLLSALSRMAIPLYYSDKHGWIQLLLSSKGEDISKQLAVASGVLSFSDGCAVPPLLADYFLLPLCLRTYPAVVTTDTKVAPADDSQMFQMDKGGCGVHTIQTSSLFYLLAWQTCEPDHHQWVKREGENLPPTFFQQMPDSARQR